MDLQDKILLLKRIGVLTATDNSYILESNGIFSQWGYTPIVSAETELDTLYTANKAAADAYVAGRKAAADAYVAGRKAAQLSVKSGKTARYMFYSKIPEYQLLVRQHLFVDWSSTATNDELADAWMVLYATETNIVKGSTIPADATLPDGTVVPQGTAYGADLVRLQGALDWFNVRGFVNLDATLPDLAAEVVENRNVRDDDKGFYYFIQGGIDASS